MLDLRTQTKMTRVIKALEELEVIREVKNPQGLYIFIFDVDTTQSVALGLFIPNEITSDLFHRVRQLAKFEGITEMMS
ncbi:hypothetical protein DRJ16_00290 [Candidatus Woesearchaeota archaeon]|nr:MAG: hypothetical protein DRJ16_00290 [Candidatus Woesearchaeota archaeon]